MAHWGVESQLHTVFTLALHEYNCWASRSGRFFQGKTLSTTQASIFGEQRIFCSCWETNHDLSAVQLIVCLLHRAMPATEIFPCLTHLSPYFCTAALRTRKKVDFNDDENALKCSWANVHSKLSLKLKKINEWVGFMGLFYSIPIDWVSIVYLCFRCQKMQC